MFKKEAHWNCAINKSLKATMRDESVRMGVFFFVLPLASIVCTSTAIEEEKEGTRDA